MINKVQNCNIKKNFLNWYLQGSDGHHLHITQKIKKNI